MELLRLQDFFVTSLAEVSNFALTCLQEVCQGLLFKFLTNILLLFFPLCCTCCLSFSSVQATFYGRAVHSGRCAWADMMAEACSFCFVFRGLCSNCCSMLLTASCTFCVRLLGFLHVLLLIAGSEQHNGRAGQTKFGLFKLFPCLVAWFFCWSWISAFSILLSSCCACRISLSHPSLRRETSHCACLQEVCQELLFQVPHKHFASVFPSLLRLLPSFPLPAGYFLWTRCP